MKHRKKRPFCLLLCALLVSPALASEGSSGFTDISPSDWYAPYVDICVDGGILEGTEENSFSPEAPLTCQEALVALMRLHSLRQDRPLPPPPEVWGTARMDFEDGTSLLIPIDQMDLGGSGMGMAYAAKLPAEKAAVINTHQGQGATLTDLSTGAAIPIDEIGAPFWGDEEYNACLWVSKELPSAFASRYREEWFGPALWYATENGLLDNTRCPKTALLGHMAGYGEEIKRTYFAAALAELAGELEPRNTIGSLPDLDREDGEGIYRLYEAGILTGYDPCGTFYGDGELTRGEAAAMIARVLRPELRLSFTPIPLPQAGEGYSLTAPSEEGPSGEGPASQSWREISRYWTSDGRYYYIDGSRAAVSQKFDRAGSIGPDGQGLVELEGKEYRIQFE